jgi:glutaredoxin
MAVRKDRGRIAWVDIWKDDAGRAYVASVNGGDETVPTVVIDGTPHTNPDPAMVKAVLTAR